MDLSLEQNVEATCFGHKTTGRLTFPDICVASNKTVFTLLMFCSSHRRREINSPSVRSGHLHPPNLPSSRAILAED
jgi:hypothetical protein